MVVKRHYLQISMGISMTDIVNKNMTPIVIRDEYTAYLEPFWGSWMFHIWIYNGTPSVIKDIKTKLNQLCDFNRGKPYYALLDPAEKPNEAEVNKQRRWMKLMGFDLHSIVQHNTKGHSMELYWIPNNGETNDN